LEASPNNRAGCSNAECKKAAVKIMKGEFRYAIQVTIQEHQSWQYRHWGCVTPKQIENLVETSGGDTDLVDGYDELPAEFQEKVEFALKNGHVPDEDWKGVSLPFCTK
ncbi:zf-PARP-domain-containing protein, partial [Setomelanomma holmii]